MSSHRQTIHSIHNKKFWTEFFHLYESLPALWDMNNPLYKNRQVKCDAYDIMVDKLREVEPNADREDVLRKINIFRTNFRRECSRINMSLREGRYYQSTLWYFDLLCFLQTVDTRRDRKRKIDDGEKSIMRKRRTANSTHKSTDQASISSKKDHLIEYQPHEYEYDLEEEPDFDYVPDELTHGLVDDKNDRTSRTQQNHLALNNYQGVEEEEEENDEDGQSQDDYNHKEQFQDYTLQRNIQTNNKRKLSNDDVSKLDNEITTNETPHEMNEDDQQVYNEYTADNESETLQTTQWCMKPENAQNISTLQLEKVGLHITNTATKNNLKFNNNASTKFVRDVKTMTSNSSYESCCSKISESSQILAKSWAVQYDELSQDQKLLARKAINDILFEGCMGHLAIGSNGRVDAYAADYNNLRKTKVTSNEEVESSEIYEQSTITASSTSSSSGAIAGSTVTLTTNAVSTTKVHATDEWLKL